MAVAEVAVEEVNCHFVEVVASAGEAYSPLDSTDCRAASRPDPCFDCSSPFDRRVDSVETEACLLGCDEFVCSDAFVHPYRRQLDSGRACLSSCRNL